MKPFLLLALPLCLAACGPKGGDVTLSVGGVTMADVEAIRGELSSLKGVGDVKTGAFKDGQVTYTVRFEGKGGDLASRLSSLGSNLKNVKGFDDQSVQVAYGAAVVPAPAPVPAPAVAPKPEAPKEVKVEVKK